jgi:endoglucanase
MIKANYSPCNADTQAPSVPTGLASSNVATTSCTLSWAASTDNVGVWGYQVYKNGVYLGGTTSLTMNITGLTCGTTYNFTVDAFDAASPANISAASTVKSVTTLACADTQAPSVPTGLTSSNVTTTSCTLSWAASTDNVGVWGYEVYKNGAYLGGTTSLSMNITGLTCGSSYNFTVDAFDAASPANISNFSAVKLLLHHHVLKAL